MSVVDKSLSVLSDVSGLKTAIMYELTTHILTTYIIYFACHRHVYLAGQRKEPRKTIRMLSTGRSAFAHHF